MSAFERYLTAWVFLCIIAGITLGYIMPGMFQAIGAAEIARVNIPVAVLIWLMIIPMLLRIDFSALGHVGQYWARHWGHAFHQLGREALFDGTSGMAFHRLAVAATAT